MAWRTIPGFEYYEVSDSGDVRRRVFGNSPRGRHNRILRPHRKRSGHLEVELFDGRGGSKWIQIHRLVLMAFVGPPPPDKPHGAHRDCNPANNTLSNFRWASPSENSADTVLLGRQARGIKAGPKKFTEHDIKRIRTLSADGMSQENIARLMSTSQSHVGRIVNRQLWGWVE